MGNSLKIPKIRNEAFTKARESLGLSTKDLSKMACLSVRQIEQIENGETSSFYGDQVKFTAAKKVAGLLKLKSEDAFELSEPLQAVKPPEVDETKEQSVKSKESPDHLKPQEIKESAPISVSPIKSDATPKPSSQRVSENVVDYRVKAKAPVEPKKKIFLMLAITAAVIFSIVNLRPLFFPEPVKEEVVIIQEVVPEAPPVNPPAEPSADAKPVSAVVTQPEPILSSECPVADATAFNYKPDAPKKAGDMVYLQSKTTQTVCVTDATGKTQNKTLEPGLGVSIFGKPPFKVLTSGLNLVDIYYQGSKVRVGNAPNKTIILEAAEIIQPAPPLTSSDPQPR